MDSTTSGTITPGAQPTDKYRLLINRDFALLWSGQAISIIGDMMFTTTLIIWIATGLAAYQSWSPVAVSGVLLATSAPTLLVGPLAGVFVDRATKRSLMLWMDGLRAIVVALPIVASGAIPLPFLVGNRLPFSWSLGLIYAVVVLVNVGEQFFQPSVIALIQDIVPPAQQARAMGLSQVSRGIALILGPSLAALLYAAFGPQWALLIDAASFAVSYLTILGLHAPQAAQREQVEQRQSSFWRELFGGLRFYFSNRVLVTLLIALVAGASGGTTLNTLDVFFATQNLHATTAMYGVLGGVFGLGTIVGSLLFGLAAQRIGLARTLWTTMTLFGILVMVVSRVTSYDVALGVFLVFGALNSALNVAAGPMLMRETPKNLMGRVMSIFQPVMNLAVLVAAAGAGYLAGVTLHGFHAHWLGLSFGAVDTIWLGGGVLMVLAGIVVLIGLRGVDRRYRQEDSIARVTGVAAEIAAPQRV